MKQLLPVPAVFHLWPFLTVFHLLPLLVIFHLLAASGTAAPNDGRGKPTADQIAWHEMEIEMFLCMDPCTWQGREYDDHSVPLSEINPADLDTDQWCRVARSFGARQILFVAKHTGGFCWWRTDTTDYSIKNTPYKDGQGDVLAELAASCRKEGLKLGVYIYPGDDQWGAGIGSGGRTRDPSKQEAYNEILRRQWTEVLTRYGEISEIWFDGGCVVALGDIIKRHAPKAMVFQGPHATLRWPGNERGIAPYPTWQTVNGKDARTGVSTGRHSDPDGDVWLPMEMDTTLLDHKWFWGPGTDHMLKPLDHLLEVYYQSVGRGCVLLLNATPDTSGCIPPSHAARYAAFGEAIRRIHENKKGEASGTGRTLELRFDGPTPVNHVITMEDIRHGHIVRTYQVEGLMGGGWQKLLDGTSIGYKKIDVIDTVEVEGLRIKVTDAVDEPVIKSFAAYEVRRGGGSVASDPGRRAGEDWHEVAGWNGVKPTDAWQTVDVDLTPHIQKPGQYQAELRRVDGEATLEVRKAVAVMAGTEAPRLTTRLDRPHTWHINRTAQVTPDARGRTVLRLEVRRVGAGGWRGRMFLRGLE